MITPEPCSTSTERSKGLSLEVVTLTTLGVTKSTIFVISVSCLASVGTSVSRSPRAVFSSPSFKTEAVEKSPLTRSSNPLSVLSFPRRKTTKSAKPNTMIFRTTRFALSLCGFITSMCARWRSYRRSFKDILPRTYRIFFFRHYLKNILGGNPKHEAH